MYVLNNKQNGFAIGSLSAIDRHTATNLKISLLMSLWARTTSYVYEGSEISFKQRLLGDCVTRTSGSDGF